MCKLRNRQYDDKDGQKKYITEIVADQVILFDKKIKATEHGTEEATKEGLSFLDPLLVVGNTKFFGNETCIKYDC